MDGEKLTIHPSHFGDRIEVPMPSDCSTILVCADTIGGHKPLKILLPHQLYVETVRKIVAEHGVKTVTIMPYRNIDKYQIAVSDLPDENP